MRGRRPHESAAPSCEGRNYSSISEDFLRTCSGISQEFQDFLRNFSGFSQEFLRNFSGISQDLRRNFSGISQEFHRHIPRGTDRTLAGASGRRGCGSNPPVRASKRRAQGGQFRTYPDIFPAAPAALWRAPAGAGAAVLTRPSVHPSVAPKADNAGHIQTYSPRH